MIRYEIRLSLAENVKTFVNIMSRYHFDIDLRAGRHVVDAKSILGIFSLDLSRPIMLEIADEQRATPEELQKMLEEIRPFLVNETPGE
ncbi:MAG: HPr family phosphocarrier protein [Clostridia bacterium]|nr:HPr family phosphocarrier protein [Clostridia bacterium]